MTRQNRESRQVFIGLDTDALNPYGEVICIRAELAPLVELHGTPETSFSESGLRLRSRCLYLSAESLLIKPYSLPHRLRPAGQ
jgi:hypothetical protein